MVFTVSFAYNMLPSRISSLNHSFIQLAIPFMSLLKHHHLREAFLNFLIRCSLLMAILSLSKAICCFLFFKCLSVLHTLQILLPVTSTPSLAREHHAIQHSVLLIAVSPVAWTRSSPCKMLSKYMSECGISECAEPVYNSLVFIPL